MGSRLIRLNDGTLVEIDADQDYSVLISKSSKEVEGNIEKMTSILSKIVNSISLVWKGNNLLKSIEKAEVELGLSFEGEGNLYVTKAKAGANVKIKLILNP